MTTSVLHEVVLNATNISPNTKARYLRDLKIWINFAGSNQANWTRKKAQAFYAELLKTMKSQSANRLMSSVRFAAKWWAIQEDNANLNFALVQEQKGSAKEPKQALTEDQALALLNTCQVESYDPVELRDFALIIVALETGMRRMSLRSMLWEQTYLQGDAKTISRTSPGYPTTRVLMKGTGTDRVTVPLSDICIRALSVWGKSPSHKSRGPVFPSLSKRVGPEGVYHIPSVGPLGETGIHKLTIERGKQIGVAGLSPHVFRHTYVTWRLAAGYQPHEVAAVTGHHLAELGAMAGYIDPIQVGLKMRESTPAWLVAYVQGRLR